MRPRRLLLVLAITGGLWAPRDAAAFCDVDGPYLGTGPQLPLGCPVHVYTHATPDLIRQLTALRDGAYVDVTGTVTQELVQLLVRRTTLDCQLRPIGTRDSLDAYDHWTIQPVGVQVGERIGLGSGWFGGIELVAAGPCAAPIPPVPECAEAVGCDQPPRPLPPFGDAPVSGGCEARGGGGLASGLALLGLIALAPRRRR